MHKVKAHVLGSHGSVEVKYSFVDPNLQMRVLNILNEGQTDDRYKKKYFSLAEYKRLGNTDLEISEVILPKGYKIPEVGDVVKVSSSFVF